MKAIGVRAAAPDGQHVEVLVDLAEPVRVGLDQGDVVFLAAQALRDVTADLAGTNNDDVHRLILADRWLRAEDARLCHDYVERDVPGPGFKQCNNLEAVRNADQDRGCRLA